MASIHKRPDSQYWHAAYFGPDGKRILRSTKQTTRQDALVTAMEYERAAKLARRGELVEARALLAQMEADAELTGRDSKPTGGGHMTRSFIKTKK